MFSTTDDLLMVFDEVYVGIVSLSLKLGDKLSKAMAASTIKKYDKIFATASGSGMSPDQFIDEIEKTKKKFNYIARMSALEQMEQDANAQAKNLVIENN